MKCSIARKRLTTSCTACHCTQTGYGTTQTGYRTTPVGCRGGSWHVEGCWDSLYLTIKSSKLVCSIFMSMLDLCLLCISVSLFLLFIRIVHCEFVSFLFRFKMLVHMASFLFNMLETHIYKRKIFQKRFALAFWHCYGTTNVGYRTTNADAGVGIGLKRGGFRNLIKKAIN